MKKIYNLPITKDHPVIKGHNVYGQSLLPGLAYIDMLFQLARDAAGLDYRKHCLKRVSIFNPLIIREERPLEIRITFEQMPSFWKIIVEGTEEDNQENLLRDKLYITAELHEKTVVFGEKINAEAMKQAATQCLDIETVYAEARKQGLVHQGLIKAKGNIYLTDHKCLIEVNVDDAYLEEAKSFLFTPTLIDGAAMASGALERNKNAWNSEVLYLPLYYESFSCLEPLHSHCYAVVSFSSLRFVNQICKMDIAFFSTEGRQIGELKGLTSKQVRFKGQINSDFKTEIVLPTNQEPSVLAESFSQHHQVDTTPAHVESLLRNIFSKHLKQSALQVDLEAGFFELGLESSQLLAILQDVENAFNLSLSPTLLFEYTTIAKLSAYITENYVSQFGRYNAATGDYEQKSPVKVIALDSPLTQFQAAVEVPYSGVLSEDPGTAKAKTVISHTATMPAIQEEIAIIGMAGRFPGARNIREFWINLKKGKDSITEIPRSRWDWHRFGNLKSPTGKNISKWGGFIDDPDCFDPQFFRISPREAESMDPQERLFLETCWEAIEDAGYTSKTLVTPRGRYKRRHVGVFVGVMHKDYTLIGAEAVAKGQVFPLSLNYAPIANRVSYICDFHGPSMAVDTVCSSSLTAVHLAIESIKHGESEVALAGGVNLSLHPNKYLTYGMSEMHSSDGFCHSFGKGGDGYVSGEGVGAVLLKPLNKAIQDNDYIYAVIKGSTINHVGTVSGITVPSPVAQADVIVACSEKTGINPRTISYVEAHGTGTSLGDPIEIQGLVKAYSQYTQDLQYCSIGSVKSNIGHAESAAGISALIKVALQLYNKTLVASLHSEELNPYIDFNKSPFYVQHKTEEWKQPVIMENNQKLIYPRRAGLSSLGATGSNAHIIVEEYIPKETPLQTPAILAKEAKPEIIPLSAKNEKQLRVYARRMLEFLKSMATGKEEEKQTNLQQILEDRIRSFLASIIHVKGEAVKVEAEWSEYGVEPIHITQLKERILEELNIETDISELVQRNSVAHVVAYLIQHHKEAIETLDFILAQYEVAAQKEKHETSRNKAGIDLSQLAHTLQVGRQAMEERLAFLAKDIPELIEKLQAFVEGKESIDICWRGQVKQSRGVIDFLSSDQDSLELIHKWIAKGNVGRIAQLWVQGYEMDWGLFYKEAKPQRISLPTYPFVRERYWVPGDNVKLAGSGITASSVGSASIHPLLHKNTSNFWQQRFSSTFTGQEFFLADHVVKEQRVLPGVGYLEMARAAVERAAGAFDEGRARIRLENVVWIQPIAVGDQPVQVHIGLYLEENGEIAYEIYSQPDSDDAEPVVHSQGSAVLSSAAEAPAIDLKALQAHCTQNILSSAQCYDAFRAMGISYGPGHQGIEKVYVGQGQVLAKLSLPASVSDTLDQFVLHPSLMDSALQASAGLTGLDDKIPSGNENTNKPVLPFALHELEILGKCSSVMWALVRYSSGSTAKDKVQNFDIDLCDEYGTICVRMKGFSTRILAGEIQANNVSRATSSQAIIEPPVGTFMLFPIWDSIPVENGQVFPSSTAKVLMVGGNNNNRRAIKQIYPNAISLDIQPRDSIGEIADKLEAHGSFDHILWAAPHNNLESLADDALIEEQNLGVIQVFRIIKALLRLGYGTRDLGWTVVTMQTQFANKKDPVNPTHASLHGLIGSLAKEYPNWKIRLIDLEADCDWPINNIFALPADRRGRAWAYRSRQWYRQQLIPFQCPPLLEQKVYRTGGVYVVIGGAGGIGEAWSEYMIRTYQALIIWIGRRKKDTIIQAKLDRIANLGSAPHYIEADATDLKALESAYEEIKRRYSQIHGVIHSAMVFSEQSLANMEEEQFKAGLSAKVDVSVRIAQVFNKEPLDFVLFFSSLITLIKNPKQSHYASGCSFKDAFAHQLAREWPCAVKVMNWGYWGSVEATASEDFKQLAQIGLGLIEPDDGMKALETLLARPINQIALMKTTKPLEVEGMKPEEFITVYPEHIPPNIHNVMIQIPAPDLQIQFGKPEINSQMEKMEYLVCKLLWGQLQSIGLFTETNPIIADLKTKTGLRDLYDRWIEESIEVLARHNYLLKCGEECTVIDPAPTDMGAVWEEWNQQKGSWLEHHNMKAQVVLVEATLRALPEILTGKVLATDIMFPNSSMELVEGIYKNNLISDYFNEVLANTVVAYIEERLKQDSSARIRIIEIGAGTGGTSHMVFEKLKPYQDHIKEYCYTDMSKAFLMHAEKVYGQQNPYMTYKIFNVEAPIAGQGIHAGGYDIAIAGNVLHATKNIRQTLRNAKAALQKNGLILLNEMTRNALFIHLTFGLLEGWWLYEDTALRIPGCPGLYPETWQAVLESEGFQTVLFPAQQAHDLGQQIIAAESDGVVRQKQYLKPSVTPVKNITYTKTLKKETLMQPRPTKQAGAITNELLREKTTFYIKQLVGETLKIPGNKIDSSEPLEKYGIDSILVVRLTNALRKELDNISTTLFFEYQTIDALVEYFMKTQKDSLIALVGLGKQGPNEEISGNEKLLDDRPQVDTNKTLRNSRRFLQYQDPENAGLVSQPSIVQDVAIIGLSGRYSGANNVYQLWNNLKEGRNCIIEIPKDRWDWKEYFKEEKGKKGSIYTKWGGFIEDIDKFDPLFFQITPREAGQMDPQERLFLEVAYESIEDAGYTPATLCESRKIGVFVGVMNGNYPTGACYWSIANRISYLLNFQGPSMAVDTACSSSLTAIHLALESLYSGVSECAIAGGVSLVVDPVHYMRLSAMTMLSSGDQCKTFGDQADGFVDGEGVGAIVLKPLHKAIADGDQIYGIIKGSMLNAGGKTNGYTVPNPNAQFSLISEALQRSRVHARTISYMEAHGTGTALGDPIEITGLSRAFEQDTKDKQFCSIGSVKSNLGHCESAAGIAGVTKVLLQLKYRQLVPSLHSKVLNPNIDFSNTPFVVQQERTEWKRPVVEINGKTRGYPRIAGISAFGAGGSNAHVLIEEYIPKDMERHQITITTQSPAIILLSAKNEERLQEQARRLSAFIQERQISDTCLADMAYTLQVGREAMEERLALVVGSINELGEKLKGYVEGQEGIAGLYRGQVKRHKEILAVFSADEDMEKIIDSWIAKGKYAKLLELWVKGLIVNWNMLYGDTKPCRISLPTYPFARERYWVSKSKDKFTSNIAVAPALIAPIHPLLQQNTSNLSGQRFSSFFTGQEFFLSDHVVKGQRVLPGVVCLEMARAAVEQAAETSKEGSRIQLKKVAWASPIAVGDNLVQVHIRLFPRDNEEIGFEIYSEPESVGAGPVVHSQGIATLGSVAKVPMLDLEALQAQCTQSVLSSNQCYESFMNMGIDYGSGYRGIEQVYVGQGQVLAKLSLPASVFGTKNQFVLHPSLMDSALQASVGLMIGSGVLRPVLPYALQELEIYGNCTSTMWGLVRYSNGSSAQDKVQKLDIDLFDEHGMICVRMKGFMFVLQKQEDFLRNFFYIPGWRQVSLTAAQMDKAGKAGGKKVVIVYSSGSPGIEKVLARAHGEDQVFMIRMGTETRRDEAGWEVDIENPQAFEGCIGDIKDINTIYFLGGIETAEVEVDNLEAFEQSQKRGVIALFRLLKSLIRRGSTRIPLHLKIITSNVHQVWPQEETKPLSAGLIGLGKSIAVEFPDMVVSYFDIGLEDGASEDEIEILAEHIICEPGHSGAEDVAIRGGKRYVRTLEPVLLPPADDLPLKKEGVYLILGGAGGIGMELSNYLAETVQARLVLIGRNELSYEKKVRISQIESKGGKVLYIKADATEPESMRRAVEEAKLTFGRINGVVHSAMSLNDYTLENMPEEDFISVLAPKTKGSLVIYQVTREEPLDFILFFSSVASFMSSVGASNYSAGITFKDAFARYLNKRSPFPVKTINWGYWGHVGSGSRQGLDKLFAARGIETHSVEEGIEAVCRILGSHADQVIAIKANKRVLEKLGLDSDNQVELYPKVIPSVIEKAVSEGFIPPLSEEKFNRYALAIGKLEEFSRCQLIDSFHKMGVLRNAGERYGREELKARLNIKPEYSRLFEVMLEILAGAGFIEAGADHIVTTEKIEENSLKVIITILNDKREQVISEYPEVEDHLKLLWICQDCFFEVLRGEIPATDVIFPNSSMKLVEGLYQGNVVADYFNSMVARILQRYIEARLPLLKGNEKIKILEVGAGIGATSSVVFKSIKDFGEKLTYYYTDISPVFARYGSKKYGLKNPYVEFKVLNIENDITDQGFDPGEVDVVIAANVIHATRNIPNTLRNVKRLLKRNGLMVLNEMTGFQVFLSASFALLDGWWLYEDQENRIDGSPMLTPETWEKLLLEEGFNLVSAWGLEKTLKQHAQHVIVAESDGAVKYRSPYMEGICQPSVDEYESPAQTEDTTKVNDKNSFASGSRDILKQNIEAKIEEIIAEVTQFDRKQIDPDLPFNDIGVDSIFAAEIVSRINDEFSLKLKSSDLLNHPTMKLFVDFVVGEAGDGVVLPGGRNGKVSSNFTEEYGSNARAGIQKIAPPVSPWDNGELFAELEKAPPDEPVAIVGVSGAMPQSEDLESFWTSLVEGNSLIIEIPEDRWDWKDYYGNPAKEANKTGSKWGGFIKDIEKFDAALFSISPREAKCMDPQQRIFLETVWSTIEDAGYKHSDLSSTKTGVFVGIGTAEYGELINKSNIDIDSLVLTGTGPSLIANRVSHFFDFQGPSEVIDTTCSGSVVAVHRAVNAIRRGECEMAIAGGVSLILSPTGYIGLAKAGMLSSSGVVKPFDRNADGFVLGEGAGAVLLKPLSKAEKDNDHIYAVIRGSAVNHGGNRKSLISPDTESQSEVIVAALKNAGVLPETLIYIESHGSGSGPGDEAEINAYSNAFLKMGSLSNPRKKRSKYCGIGSVKANIGHLGAASGISALIKVIFALRDKILPATINFKESYPEMFQEDSPFYIVDKTEKWEPIKDEEGKTVPRRAGVHSYGFGGTNAHLIIEEYIPGAYVPEVASERNKKSAQVMVFSARTDKVLKKYLEKMKNHFKKAGEISLQDVAYTLQVGREAMEERLAMVVNSIDEAVEALDSVLNNKERENVYRGSVRNKAGIAQKSLDKNYLREKAVDPAFLAEHWVRGVYIDWKSLHGSSICKRICLPTYPFARERYWFNQIPAGNKCIVQSSGGRAGLPEKMSGEGSAYEEKIVWQLINIVSDTLEIPAEEIEPGENLKKHGLDSLTAMRMLNQIREIFGEAVSLKSIVKHPTIGDMARIIARNGNPVSGRKITSGETERVDRAFKENGPDMLKNDEEGLYEFIIDGLISGKITSGQATELARNLRNPEKRGISS